MPSRFLPSFHTSELAAERIDESVPEVSTHWKRGVGFGLLGGGLLGFISGYTFVCDGLLAEDTSCSQDQRIASAILFGLPVGLLAGGFVGGTIGHAFVQGDTPPTTFSFEGMPNGARPLSKGRWAVGLDLGIDHPEPFGYGGRVHYGLTDRIQTGLKGTYMPFAADQGLSVGSHNVFNFWKDRTERRFGSVLVDTSYLFAEGPAHLFTFHPSLGYEIRNGVRKNYGLIFKLGYGYGVHWGENTPDFFRPELVECCNLPDHVHLIRPAIGFQFRQKRRFSVNYELTENIRILQNWDATTAIRLGLNWAF